MVSMYSMTGRKLMAESTAVCVGKELTVDTLPKGAT